MSESMKILFVCTGNTCRSPLAEAIARKVAIERGRADIEVGSAGTSAWEGAAASDGSLLVGMERHMDLSQHRARQLTRDLVAQSDLVLVMGPHHRERAIALGGGDKTHLLTDYAAGGRDGHAISDPIGGELDVYRETTDELEAAIRKLFDRLEREAPSGT